MLHRLSSRGAERRRISCASTCMSSRSFASLWMTLVASRLALRRQVLATSFLFGVFLVGLAALHLYACEGQVGEDAH